MRWIIFVLCLGWAIGTWAQSGTTITYQGQLQDSGGPVNDSVDMNFALYDAETGGSQVGTTISLTDVSVVDGLFQVDLNFGEQAYESGLWLAIEVEGELLAPRQAITGAPFAVSVAPGSGSNWEVSGSDIHRSGGNVGIGTSSPSVPLDVVGSAKFGHSTNQNIGAVSFVSGGSGAQPNTVNGTWGFVAGGTGNVAGTRGFVGAGIVTAATGNESFAAGARAKAEHSRTFVWSDGSDGDFASTGPNQFLIHADSGVGINTNSPENSLTVAGDANFTGSVGIGISSPSVSLEVNGAAKFGGTNHSATGNRSFVSGRGDNHAAGDGSFVGGGLSNTAEGGDSFVGGGSSNSASGSSSFVAGGVGNSASGARSFAAGRNAKAMHPGSFVWSDSLSGFESTATNQFLIQSSGGVGINTATPDRELHIRQRSTNASNIGLQIEDSAGSSNWAFYVAVSDNLGFRFNDDLKSRINASDGAYVQLSDRRLKEDIQPLDGVLDSVLALQPSSYYFRADRNRSRHSIGLIAQDVQQLFPSAVSGDENQLGISYSEITVLNTQGLIELNARFEGRISAQQDRLVTLASENAALQTQVAALKKDSVRLRRLAERNAELEARLVALEAVLMGGERVAEAN